MFDVVRFFIDRPYVGRAGEVMMDWFWSGAPRTWSLSAGVGGEVDTRHQCSHTTCSDIPQTQQHHPPRPAPGVWADLLLL